MRDAQTAGERPATEQPATPGTPQPEVILADRLTKMGLMESPTVTYDCDTTGTLQCPQLQLYYMHALGHALGLKVHDTSDYEHSPFTIEPSRMTIGSRRRAG